MSAPEPSISLRPVKKKDAQIIFEWQCLPETRKHSRNPQPPEWEEHIEWLKKTLNDPDKSPYIIEYKNEAAGMLRIDKMEQEREFEISILIAPKHYQKGLAGKSLQMARDIKPNAIFMAYVQPENTASIQLFTGQNYEAVDNNWYQQLSKTERPEK